MSHNRQKEYISKNPKELSNYFKDEGNKFYNRRDYEVAIIYFNKAIEMDPDNKIFYCNRKYI